MKIVAVCIFAYLLKLSGFCFHELRWLTGRELIERAFEYQKSGGAGKRPAVKDVVAFIDEHPRCCDVLTWGGFLEPPLLNPLFGRRFYEVRIQYPVADPARNQGNPYYMSILIMECCGDDVADSYGMEFDEPIPKGPFVPRSGYTPPPKLPSI